MAMNPRDAASVLDPNIDGDRVFIEDRCANCLGWMPDALEGLFCSDWCSEVTKHVRYFRRVFRDGRIDDPDVQVAVRTRLAFLPSGGYQALGRTLDPHVRAQVIERDLGLCRQCGNPGTDIDHIARSSPALANLQLLCGHCHRIKTQQNMVPADERTRQLIDTLMRARVFVDEPKLLADDELAWDHAWRALKKARKQRLVDELEQLGIDTGGVRSRADLIVLRDEALADLGDDEDAEWDAEAASSDDGGYGINSYFAHAMERDD